jgi:D-alanyl-lipoteichoic acid acyltransferase DltB (MBOAT superfamily)
MSSGVYKTFEPMAIMPLCYATINVLWLKFLVLWRFFRGWALIDGIESPENMDRCVSNHYSLSGFWRSWHKSYNRWLTRYLYIPLGGNRVGMVYKIGNILIVFTYVALWHDMTFKLLTWGWVIGICFIPEVAGTVVFKNHFNKWYMRFIIAAGGATNIFCMILGNIIGFGNGVGNDGILVYIGKLFTGGWAYLLIVWISFFVAVVIMLEVRKVEAEREKDKHALDRRVRD